MEITPKMVRDLRDLTGAGMMECKKALEASGGDKDAAVDLLRKQGLKAALKKAERSTVEGRIVAVPTRDGRRAHLIGVACETDFLAKSDKFRAFVAEIEQHVLTQDPTGIEDGARPLLDQRLGGEGAPVREALQQAAGSFGENTRITECVRFENPRGLVGTYVHHDGKQGAIVSVTTQAPAARAAEALKSLCQQVVVFRPSYTNRSDVPAAEVERERQVILSAEDMQKRPENVRDKMAAGRLNAFYAQQVLAEQPWIHDDKLSVQKALEAALGPGTTIAAFRRVHLGSS
jgi:elongation factor Ts